MQADVSLFILIITVYRKKFVFIRVSVLCVMVCGRCSGGWPRPDDAGVLAGAALQQRLHSGARPVQSEQFQSIRWQLAAGGE